jgi:uncharacterized protein
MAQPQRTCVACRTKAEQSSFLRVIRAPGERAVLWTKGAVGRSAYICRQRECVAEALKKGRLERAFRGPVSPEERKALEEELVCKLR